MSAWHLLSITSVTNALLPHASYWLCSRQAHLLRSCVALARLPYLGKGIMCESDLRYTCRLHMALPASLSKEARAHWHKLVEGFREPISMTAISQVCRSACPSSGNVSFPPVNM